MKDESGKLYRLHIVLAMYCFNLSSSLSLTNLSLYSRFINIWTVLPYKQIHRDIQHKKIFLYMTQTKSAICLSVTDSIWPTKPTVIVFCLLFWGLSSHSRIFHAYGDVIIYSEGLQMLTYARHSRPLSSDGSYASHPYCHIGHPFTMIISEPPWHSHLLPKV